MRRKATGLVLGTVMLALVAGVAVSAALAAGGGGKPAAKGARVLAGVNFVSECKFVHFLPDDPIVFPGQPGISHDHTFVGNASTDASSTLASLQAAGTTCQRPDDTAAYWMPTLIVDGQPVTPLGATIYYRRNTMSRVTGLPGRSRDDRRRLEGDDSAEQADHVLELRSRGGSVPTSDAPPACPSAAARGSGSTSSSRAAGTGRAPTAPTTRATWRTRRGRCPADHPVAVPAITLISATRSRCRSRRVVGRPSLRPRGLLQRLAARAR